MRDMERFHSTTIDFGGKEVDLTERDRDELETMDELLTRNLDAEIDAQKARGGTQPSSLAQDFGKRQGRVSSEIQFRREMEQNEAVGSHRGTADIFRGPTTPTDIGRRSSGRFDRPDSNPDVEPQAIARNKKTGRFAPDPFDITSGGVGDSVGLFSGRPSQQELFGREERDILEDEFQSATDSFDEIGRDDRREFFDTAAELRERDADVGLDSARKGGALAVDASNTLLDRRRR